MTGRDNALIARNTGLLFIRLLVSMFISLYTSRVVLKSLGVMDFGIQNAVSGMVLVLSFLGNTMSSTTSRFLSYEMGSGESKKISQCISASLVIHAVLATVSVLLLETIGYWFLRTKMKIPSERVPAAYWVFQFSILNLVFSFLQSTYSAVIIAYEKIKFFAYVGIVEVAVKLGLALALSFTNYDKMIAYAFLMMLMGLFVFLAYLVYCIRNIKGSKFNISIDRVIYKELATFSGWGVVGNFSHILSIYGANIMLNSFFGPSVNAARAIATQVDTAIMAFVQNFRTASYPQIVKLHASGNDEEMRKLVTETTKLSYFLFLLLALPVLLEANTIIKIWLGIIPNYVVLFVQLTLIQKLVSIFDGSFFYVLYAMGKLKENAIYSTMIVNIWLLPVSFLLFRLGNTASTLYLVSIAMSSMLSFLIKPFLLWRYANYRMIDFLSIFLPCLWVTLVSLAPPLTVLFVMEEGWERLALVAVSSIISVVVGSAYLGIGKDSRTKIWNLVLKYVRYRKSP